MKPDETSKPAALEALRRAAREWVELGREAPIARWLDRELDGDGVPKTLDVTGWAEGLADLADARGRRPGGWPDRFDAVAEGWFRSMLRYSRPDGSSVFSAAATRDGRKGLFREWAERLADPG